MLEENCTILTGSLGIRFLVGIQLIIYDEFVSAIGYMLEYYQSCNP